MPSTENAIRLPERKSGVFDRRGRRIADELEAQVEEKTMFGQLPLNVNTNLAAYDESVTCLEPLLIYVAQLQISSLNLQD